MSMVYLHFKVISSLVGSLISFELSGGLNWTDTYYNIGYVGSYLELIQFLVDIYGWNRIVQTF